MLRNLTSLFRNQQRSFSTAFLYVSIGAALVALAAVYCTSRRPDSPTIRPKMRIVPVPVRSDNYACEEVFTAVKSAATCAHAVFRHLICADLLIDDETKTAAAVDPYDVKKGVRDCASLCFFVID